MGHLQRTHTRKHMHVCTGTHEWRRKEFHTAILNAWTHSAIWTVKQTHTHAHTRKSMLLPSLKLARQVDIEHWFGPACSESPCMRAVKGLSSLLTERSHPAPRLQDDTDIQGVSDVLRPQGPWIPRNRGTHMKAMVSNHK